MDRKGKNSGTLRSYEKGQSGNPAGRPLKKPGVISQILAELGNDWDDLEVSIIAYTEGDRPKVYHRRYSTDGDQVFNAAVAAQLLMRCLAGDMEAIKIVLDRTEGRVPPPINIGQQSNGSQVSVINYKSDKAANQGTEF